MNSVLPRWLESFLGLRNTTDEAALWELAFFRSWPTWLTLAVLIFAAAFAGWIYYHEGRAGFSPRRILPAAMRFALFGLVLFMLAQPMLLIKHAEKPALFLLVDDSLSMTIVDHYAEKQQAEARARLKNAGLQDELLSRWNLLAAVSNENHAAWLHGLAEKYKLQVYFLCDMEKVQTHNPAKIAGEIRTHVPRGKHSRIGDGIRRLLDESAFVPPAAVVVLSDGVNTAGISPSEAADFARRRNVPIYFLGIGSEQPPKDLAVSELLADEAAFVGDTLSFQCRITAYGLKGRKATVLLRESGRPKVLSSTDVVLGEDGVSQLVRLSVRAEQEGRFEYVVEVPPLEGESQKDNNRRSCIVEVRKGKLHLLLADGSPRYEFRYLRNLLRREESLALKTLLQDADPEYASQDETALTGFPSRREELFQFDVVIFGDLNPELLGRKALEMLVEFVEQPTKGGSLVMIAGERFLPAAYKATPLAKLLPFNLDKGRVTPAPLPPQGFRPQPTALGMASPGLQLDEDAERARRLWQELPALYWLLALPELKPGVRILAEYRADENDSVRALPVICFHYAAAGKVLFHATDETWRWRYRRDEAVFARYWLQTIRSLSRPASPEKTAPLVLESERREYVFGETVRLRVRFADDRQAPAADDGVAVILESPEQQRRQIRFRRTVLNRSVFEAVLTDLPPGNYRARIVEPLLEPHPPAVEFIIAPPATEFARTQMDAAEMRRAAAVSGGKYFAIDEADRLAKALPAGAQTVLETLPPRPLWNSRPLLVIFLGLLIVEWILRKQSGLV